MRRERRRPISGGHFDYKQHHIRDIANDIESAIYRSKKKEEDYYVFSDKTIQEFNIAIRRLHEAEVYAQRIDWLLSGDDGEDTFHERLKADLKELEKK
jgi:hypothetical protein